MNGIDQRLDECRVAVTPPLNSDHESLAAPEVKLEYFLARVGKPLIFYESNLQGVPQLVSQL